MLPVCGGSSVARGWNIDRLAAVAGVLSRVRPLVSCAVCVWCGGGESGGVSGVVVVWCAVGCLRGRLWLACSCVWPHWSSVACDAWAGGWCGLVC